MEFINSVIKKIESLMEKSISLSLATSSLNCYQVDIVKTGGSEYTKSPSGLLYRDGYETLIEYFQENVKSGFVGVSIRVDLGNKFYKIYSMILNFQDNSMKLLPSKSVLKAHTKNTFTGEDIEPEKNAIYCGEDKDDVICGFNLI